MAKLPLTQDIEESVRNQFYGICEHVTAAKNEVLSVMIEAFAALSEPVQDALLSKRPGVKAAALGCLSELLPAGLAGGHAAKRRSKQDPGDQCADRRKAG